MSFLHVTYRVGGRVPQFGRNLRVFALACELLMAVGKPLMRSGAMHSQPTPAVKSVRERPPVSFGARLRHERERRKISIAAIAENTKILGALLEGLEKDDVSRWPTGFYRRAFIRAYASAIGLDPDTIMREFADRFPDPEETVSMPAPAAAVAAPAPATFARRRVQLTLSAPQSACAPGQVVAALRDRLRAIVLDAFVIGVTGLAMFLAFEQFWAPTAIAVASYYAISILVFGNTPGVCLFAADRGRPSGDGARSTVDSPRSTAQMASASSTVDRRP